MERRSLPLLLPLLLHDELGPFDSVSTKVVMDSERLQNALLAYLDEHDSINDTRDLILPTSPPTTFTAANEDQLTLRGALDSLTLREVSSSTSLCP